MDPQAAADGGSRNAGETSLGKNGKCCEDEKSCGSGGCGCGCDCECCSGGGFKRQYWTRAEQIEELEPYLEELKLEVQAVEEMLADLKKKK